MTKQPLDVALKQLVLDPLKMHDTTFHVQGAALERFARPRSSDPDMWVFQWLDVTKAPKRFSGGAGMASTTADYFRLLQMVVNGGTLDGVRLLSPMTLRWAMADQIGTTRGTAHPGDGYSWNLVNPVRVTEGGATFPGSVGDVFWGGITGPRYFFDTREKLVGVVFMQGPSQRAASTPNCARWSTARCSRRTRRNSASRYVIRARPIRHPIAGSYPAGFRTACAARLRRAQLDGKSIAVRRRRASSAGWSTTWCIGTSASCPGTRSGEPSATSARPRGSRRE